MENGINLYVPETNDKGLITKIKKKTVYGIKVSEINDYAQQMQDANKVPYGYNKNQFPCDKCFITIDQVYDEKYDQSTAVSRTNDISNFVAKSVNENSNVQKQLQIIQHIYGQKIKQTPEVLYKNIFIKHKSFFENKN